ncbi:hypothetical protein PtB15_18B165 [Puccinia triticina]|nr:hypothetical protein PtB15_18B165 [Puccinia triticina]
MATNNEQDESQIKQAPNFTLEDEHACEDNSVPFSSRDAFHTPSESAKHPSLHLSNQSALD